MAAHEALVEEFMRDHPGVTWQQAYDCTADAAYDRMADKLADMADHYRQREKDGTL